MQKDWLRGVGFAAAAVMAAVLPAATIDWTGAVDSFFATPGNWNGGGAPTTADTAQLGADARVVLANAAAPAVTAGPLVIGSAAGTAQATITDGTAAFNTIIVGNVAGSTGKLVISGGKLSTTATSGTPLIVANAAGSAAEIEMSGGEFVVTQNIFMGAYGSVTFRQTGGIFRASNWVALGRYAGGQGTWIISGGQLLVPNTGNGLYPGEESLGTLTVSDTGYVEIGGRLAFNGGSTVNLLPGGVIATAYAERGKTNYTGEPTINFNGGTLRALGTSHLNPWINANVTRLYVADGGAIIDIPAGDAVVNSPFALAPGSTSGGLTKKGAGTLKLMAANTYPGATTISEGCLVVNAASGIASTSAITVATGAGFGVNMADYAAWKTAMAGKTTWAPGAFFVADTSADNVALAATDLPTGTELAKTGANVLTITSPLQGVTEIRIYGGIVKAGTADAIPATTKIVLLGGSYAPFETSFTDLNRFTLDATKPLGLAAVTDPLNVDFGGAKEALALGTATMPADLLLNDVGANQPLAFDNPIYWAAKDAVYAANLTVGASEVRLTEPVEATMANVTKRGAGKLVLEKGLAAAGREFTVAGGEVEAHGDVSAYKFIVNGAGAVFTADSEALTLENSGAWISVGHNTANNTFNFNGGTITTPELSIAFDTTGSSGTFNQLGGTVKTSNWLDIGRMGAGTYNLRGGHLVSVGPAALDYTFIGGYNTSASGTSTLNMTGSDTTIDLLTNFQIGRYKTGVFNQSAGVTRVNGWTAVGRYSGAVGTYNLTGGEFIQTNANYGVIVGEGGTGTLNVSGTGKFTTKGPLRFANATTASGALNVSNGGEVWATQLRVDYPERPTSVTVDGGTIGAVGEGQTYAEFFSSLKNFFVGPGGLTLDTGNNTVSLDESFALATGPGGLVKTGSGTLNLPAQTGLAGGVTVREGTLAPSSAASTVMPTGTKKDIVKHLIHRWRFNGDLVDTVTGQAGKAYGSTSFEEDAALRLPGGNKGAGYVDLGANLVPKTGPFTVEVFGTLRGATSWAQILAFGDGGTANNFHMSWTYQGNITSERVELYCSAASGAHFATDASLQPYTIDTPWHIAATFTPLANGKMKIFWVKESLDGATRRYKTVTTGAAFNFSMMNQSTFWLGHSPWNDQDANASYDEVRIWDVALSMEQLLYNAKLGAEKLPNADLLAHRWSFNGDLEDAVTGEAGTMDGSAAFNAANTAVVLTGGARGTGAVDLGLDLLPQRGDPVTIEVWATVNAVKSWERIFDYGKDNQNYITMSWVRGTDANTDRVELRNGNTDLFTSDETMKPYALNTPYHISMRIARNANGTSTVRWARRNATTGAIEKQGSATSNAAWSLANFSGAHFYIGRSQFSGDNDSAATYDEVRVWRGTLTDEQLTANVLLGADTLPEHPAFELKAGGNAFSPLVVEEGATFTTGALEVEADTVTGTGTITGDGRLDAATLDVAGNAIGTMTLNGNLAVTGEWVVDVARDRTADALAGDGTLDLTGATIRVRDETKLRGGPYFIANVRAVTGAETAKLVNAGSYMLKVHGGRVMIESPGLIVIVR